MAKANDKSSTIDWIWLHDALMLAIPRFGSVVLAKERLTEGLAAGKLPWSCMSWWGLDAEGIARLDQENRVSIVGYIIPSVAYHEGDPQFWRANLKIDWEDNGARQQATGGARALGIKISREHLVALLPEEPREHGEKPAQTRPAEPESLEKKAWLAWALKEYPKQRNELPTHYISRLHGLMEKADNVTDPWKYKTFRIRYYDAVKAERQAVQKER
jgi:hypothetical protein